MSIVEGIARLAKGLQMVNNNDWNNPDDPYSSNNGDAIRMAGWGVLSGQNLGEAMQSVQKVKQQQKEEAALQHIQGLTANLDVTNPIAAIGQLAQQGIPIDSAVKMVQAKTEAQKENGKAKLLQSLFGLTGTDTGGVPDPQNNAMPSQPGMPANLPMPPVSGATPAMPGGTAGTHSQYPDPNKVMAMGAVLGDPQLLQYGNNARQAQYQDFQTNMETNKTNFDQEKALRGEFTTNTKPAIDLMQKYKQINKLAKVGTTAGDTGLINMMARMLSPGIVTAQDYIEQQKTGGSVEQFKAYLDQIAGNGKLTPAQREEIKQATRGIAQSAAQEYQAQAGAYGGLAGKHGIKSDRVITDFGYGDTIKDLLKEDAPKPNITALTPAAVSTATARAKAAGYNDAEIAAYIKSLGGK